MHSEESLAQISEYCKSHTWEQAVDLFHISYSTVKKALNHFPIEKSAKDYCLSTDFFLDETIDEILNSIHSIRIPSQSVKHKGMEQMRVVLLHIEELCNSAKHLVHEPEVHETTGQTQLEIAPDGILTLKSRKPKHSSKP